MAELLGCGVEVDATATFDDMSTPLEMACLGKDLDTVRFLLQRGASGDHLNSHGLSASSYCWALGDRETKHTSADIFNLLAEHTCPDLVDACWIVKALGLACNSADGSHIDPLVRFGLSKRLNTWNNEEPTNAAAYFGNYSTYVTILSYYDADAAFENIDFVSTLLHMTIVGYANHLSTPLRNTVLAASRLRGYNEIIANILERGVDPRSWVRLASTLPQSRNKDIRADQLAAALGPETEAWYLSMVRKCCSLNEREEQEHH